MCVCVCVCVCVVGEVPFNHEILREANALCHRLPVLNTLKFKTDFYDVSVSVSSVSVCEAEQCFTTEPEL